MFNKENAKTALIAKTEEELEAALAAERPDELAARATKVEEPKDEGTPKAPITKPDAPVLPDDVPAVVDGVDYKERYRNLQKFMDKTLKPKYEKGLAELNDKIAQLTATIESQRQNAAPTELPRSVEEVEALKKENPAAYAAITAIARDIADGIVEEKVKSLKKDVDAINNARKQTDEEKAWIELQRRHKDLDLTALNEDSDFHVWLQGKSQRFQDALYNNKGDVDAASDVLDAWKDYNGSRNKKSNSKVNASDAARAVKNKGNVELSEPQGDFDFSESQIEAMDAKTYEKNAEAIEKAMRAGRVLLDKSNPLAAARVSAKAV